MSDGTLKNLAGDARVTLTSSDTSCVDVVSDLAQSGYDYFAVSGGTCSNVTIYAIFTIGTWTTTRNATVYIACQSV